MRLLDGAGIAGFIVEQAHHSVASGVLSNMPYANGHQQRKSECLGEIGGMNKGEEMKQRSEERGAEPMVIQPYSRLVSLPIGPENIFYFPQGMPAFEEFRQYVFAFNPEYKPFVFMNSIDPAGLSFVCVDPFLVYPGYAPRLSIADQRLLNATRPEEVQLLSIVTVRRDMRETTANLQGPIAINIQNSLCKQILCEGQTYPIRHRILDALETVHSHQESEAVEFVEEPC